MVFPVMSRILVVDDEPSVLKAYGKILRKAGHEVLEAANGREALDVVQRDSVDLIVIDVFMPDVDGVEFTIRLKNETPDSKIIVVSGGGTIGKDDALELASRIGADRTLGKPFSADELIGAASEVLAQD
jgi:CheY-like chemotaxis protein